MPPADGYCGDGQCIHETCSTCPQDCGQCSISGDVNRDNMVDLKDLIFIAHYFGKTGPGQADLNNDGVINLLDLIIVARNFGN